ncbi:MAG TPA: hypothetical protein VMB05_11045 [Solirubrobacteraceae bacterium]|jgi:hypothetical protein|nr:hypothetical protein [Solirubrobacteraceae bacterium]HUB74945.1 hypothetical protein [Solirubrobacteraceae bacterium]
MTTHHTDERPSAGRRGRWFVALALVVDIPLLIVFSATKAPGWAGAATSAFTLICGALYVVSERQSL